MICSLQMTVIELTQDTKSEPYKIILWISRRYKTRHCSDQEIIISCKWISCNLVEVACKDINPKAVYRICELLNAQLQIELQDC